ncbi:MAG: methyl-accepting chemotaxis protein [Clostridium sp.]|nr:methyl-accepting chemotaxis protein [Clostridium sp.]
MKHSLRVRITLTVSVTVLLACLIMGMNCIIVSRRVTREDSNETLTLLNQTRLDELNNTIGKIEQSVDSLSNITISTIEDFEQFKTNGEYVTDCTKALEVTTNNLALNTQGALCAYIRYNPEFTDPTSGIFLSKNGDVFDFLVPTDFSIYDPSDLTHVGWYYIPVQAGEPIWMDPYLNENINVYMISYVVPIFIDGTSVGIVGMDVDFSEIESLVSETKVYDTGYAYLLNASGNILVHKDYDTGTSLEDVLPDEYKLVSDSANEGKVVNTEGNSLVYKTLNNGMKLVVKVPDKELLSSTNALTVKMILMACFALIIAVIFAIFISGTIANPIKKLTDIIRHTADLDFTTQVDERNLVSRNDEIGEMAKAIMGMRDHLEEMVRDIENSCGELNISLEHLKNSADGVAQITESNSSFTQQLATGMSESGDAIERVQYNLQMVTENAFSIEKLSEEGKGISSEIMERAAHLLDSTQNASAKTKNMYNNVKKEAEEALEKSKAVEQINELTNAIDAISSQTSLLALNASIEAARAGEAGKGFAVVATEISNLAHQTSETVSNINKIVGDVNQAVTDMTRCLDASMEFMGETVLEDYEEFGKVSEQYKNDAFVVERNMSSVNTAITQLSNSMNEIKEAVEGIGNAVSEAGISINEIAASTTDMAEQTGKNKGAADNSLENIQALSSIVDQFQIRN